MVTARFGALIVVTTGGVVQPVPTQSGSPPPVTVAAFDTLVPAAAVGVTLTVKLTVLFGATFDRPAATAQVTFWPLIVQPVAVLIVRPAGTASVTDAATVVAVVPLFVTVIT